MSLPGRMGYRKEGKVEEEEELILKTVEGGSGGRGLGR